MRAGVVSDTHGRRPEVFRALSAMGSIDLLIHAGDGLEDISAWRRANPSLPLMAVAGNCDFACGRPEEILFSLGTWKVFLTHGHRYGVKGGLDTLRARGRAVGADLVIFGHTHRADRIDGEGPILFNPGSLSQPRAPGGRSYGMIEAGPDGLTLSLHSLP